MQTLLKIGVLMLAATLGEPLLAAGTPPTGAAALQVAQKNCLSLGEAVARVRRQYNGRIVSAETRRSGNREVHHIKVLTEDGKVKTERIPGCTIGSRG